MLTWTSEDGTAIGIGFRGYQYPDATDEWDANWLNVHVRVEDGAKAWETVSASFLTGEVAGLRRWLAGITSGDDVEAGDSVETIEPEIAVVYHGSSGGRYQLTVMLNLGHMPDRVAEKHRVVDIGLTDGQLAESVDFLLEVEQRLPAR